MAFSLFVLFSQLLLKDYLETLWSARSIVLLAGRIESISMAFPHRVFQHQACFKGFLLLLLNELRFLNRAEKQVMYYTLC